MTTVNDYIIDAYCGEKTNIQNHYQNVIQELDIVKNKVAGDLASNPLYEPILRAMIFIRTQTVTNIGFQVKEFNEWTSTDIPVSYYPFGSGKVEIAQIQGELELLDHVSKGQVFGNIFSAKSLVYIKDKTLDKSLVDAITSGAAQIFPISLEQFGAYVGIVADSIVNLDNTVKARKAEINEDRDPDVNQMDISSEELQQVLETTMKDLNYNILKPMNEWRTEYLDGVEDEFAEVSKREMGTEPSTNK